MRYRAMATAAAPVFVCLVVLIVAASACDSSASPAPDSETTSRNAANPLDDPRQVIESTARLLTHNLRNQPDLRTATASKMTLAEAEGEIAKLGGNAGWWILVSRTPEEVWLVTFRGSFVGSGQDLLYEPQKGMFVVVIGATSGAWLLTKALYDEPTPTPARCGPWGTRNSPISDQYGEIKNCGFFNGYWVITTLGREVADGTSLPGVVALYFCEPGNYTCEDGNLDHPVSGWTFVSAPYAGGVTLLEHQARNWLVLSNGGHQLIFDLSSQRFIDDKPVATP